MTKLESHSKKYFFILLFVLLFPNVVMFVEGTLRNLFEINLIDYYRVIITSANYFARLVLAIFLFFDLRRSAIPALQVIILALAFLNPFIATILYFIAAFLYKPQKLSV